MQQRVTLKDVFEAQKSIRGKVLRTPLVTAPRLSNRFGAEILMKMETLQPIGAFKQRGATNAVAHLSETARKNGVVCCSTGNHGRALAFAARAAGVKAVVCLSNLVPDVKVKAIEELGADVRRVGTSQDEAQNEVTRLVSDKGMTDIPPFDHPDVLAGQGTIGLELLEDQPDLETIMVPLSGGGLAGGIALAAKTINPKIRIVGISMENGAAMARSLCEGKPVEVEEYASLADSLGGGIGLENRWTYPLCRDYLDDVVTVSEEEIYQGMQVLFHDEGIVAEGGSAVSVAALLAQKSKANGKTAMIISGKNVDMTQFTAIITGQDVILGDTVLKGERYA